MLIFRFSYAWRVAFVICIAFRLSVNTILMDLLIISGLYDSQAGTPHYTRASPTHGPSIEIIFTFPSIKLMVAGNYGGVLRAAFGAVRRA